MQRKSLLLVLSALLFFKYAQAQHDKFIFKLAPLSLIDPFTPCIQLGLEFKPTSRLGLQMEYGYSFEPLARLVYKKNTWSERQEKYYKLRAEVRYYFIANYTLQPYIALESFWIPHTYRKHNNWFVRGNQEYQYDYADIRKNVWGGCAKVGMQRLLSRRWILDVYTGLGARRVAIRYTPYNEHLPAFRLWEEAFTPGDRYEGVVGRLHLSLGFRIGYVLVKK